MWGPWAIGMATASTINRFEHVGLHMFDPKAGLTVLEAALGIKRAELVVDTTKPTIKVPILRFVLFTQYSESPCIFF